MPKTWDAFIDFFKPVQDKLRAQGMRNVYALGYQLTANGVDPINTFNAFLIAYGGKDLVTAGRQAPHRRSAGERRRRSRRSSSLTTAFKEGYVPPGCVNWNDADDNNAFHAKLIVMDFDGTISTEVALYRRTKEDYDDIVTRGLPLGNDGKPSAEPGRRCSAPVIPKGAKNVEVGQGIPQIHDPAEGAERVPEGRARPLACCRCRRSSRATRSGSRRTRTARPMSSRRLLGPTVPIYVVYNPAIAQVGLRACLQRSRCSTS